MNAMKLGFVTALGLTACASHLATAPQTVDRFSSPSCLPLASPGTDAATLGAATRAWPRDLTVSPSLLGTLDTSSGVTNWQGAGPADDTPAPFRQDAKTVSSAFPERRAIEALERLALVTPLRRTPQDDTITLASDDLFDPGSAELKASARWTLGPVAEALAAQGSRSIAVRVYTDALGDPAESTALSQERAGSLREYFVARGASAEHVQAQGFGPAHPVAGNATAEDRATNRRVEIVIDSSAPDALVRPSAGRQ